GEAPQTHGGPAAQTGGRGGRSKKRSPAGLPAGPQLAFSPVTLDGDDRHDLQRDRVHEHDLVLHDEELEPAESRRDYHDVLRHHEQVEAPRNHRAHAEREVHAAHAEARHEVFVDHHALDSSPLLAVERHLAVRGRALSEARAVLLAQVPVLADVALLTQVPVLTDVALLAQVPLITLADAVLVELVLATQLLLAAKFVLTTKLLLAAKFV